MSCEWVLSKKANIIWGTVLLVIGVCFVTVGILLPRVVDDQIDKGVKKVIVVDSIDSDNYDSWRTSTLSSSAPRVKSYYMFNITNIAEVRNGSYPILEQVGPYRYRYYQEKVDVVFKQGGQLSEFKTYEHSHWFAEDNPGLSPKDVIYTVNPAYVLLMSRLGSAVGAADWESVLLPAMSSGFLNSTWNLLSSTVPEIVKTNTRVLLGSSLPIKAAPWYARVGSADKLVDETEKFSFANALGSSVWTRAGAGDQDALLLLSSKWNIPFDLTMEISGWLKSTFNQSVPAAIKSRFGVAVEDLPLLQWLDLSVLRGRIKDVVDGLPPSPSRPQVPPFAELGAFATLTRDPSPFTSLDQVQVIFRGNDKVPSFINPLAVGSFLRYLAMGNLTTIKALWGWSPVQASYIYRFISFAVENTAGTVIRQGNGGLFSKFAVGEFLFGFNDTLFALIGPDNNPVKLTTNHTSVEEAQRDSTSVINTGSGNINDITKYFSWKNQTEIRSWATPESVMAFDASAIPPNAGPLSEVTFFSTTLQRRLNGQYKRDVAVKGISLREYGIPDNQFSNSKENPANLKFYANINGLHNMTSCEIIPGASGIPVFFSRARMMMVDSSVTNKVFMKGSKGPGMTSDPSQHDSFLRFEPTTGRAMDVALRLQVNLQINPARFQTYHKSLPNETFYLPVYWSEDRSLMTDKQAKNFKDAIETPRGGAKVARILLLVFGVLLTLFGVALLGLGTRRFVSEESTGDGKKLDLFN